MALCGAHALNPTDALPPVLVRDILSHLPADQLARAACVCRAWKIAVADPALWRRLDLAHGSGVTCRVDDAALRATAARARGGLEALDVTGERISWEAVLAVAAANAATLRELRTAHNQEYEWTEVPHLQALLAAAPTLQVVEADVLCDCATARRLLRNEPPFGLLRLRGLFMEIVDEDEEADRTFPALAELVAHPLTRLELSSGIDAPLTPDKLGVVADAAHALRLSHLHFGDCVLSPAAAPALARMLCSAALTEFNISNEVYEADEAMFDVPAAALLSNTLRANRTLRSFKLRDVLLWDVVHAAVLLLGALTGHASIRTLELPYNRVTTDAAAVAGGFALGLLVAADAPALEELDLSECDLGDTGLGSLVDALPYNHHLRKLRIGGNRNSAAFAATRLLPAVRANTSLRYLEAYDFDGDIGDGELVVEDGMDEAMQLVKTREEARVAAEAAAAARGA
jgi:hypothetical protein